MSDAMVYSALNDLLINMSRSLLQYVGECWPWSDAETQAEQKKIDELVKQQEQQVAQLVALLQDAEWAIDFGRYPTEYTDLHYVALDYLLNQLVVNQQAVVEDARRTLPECQGHPEAKQLVGEIVALQQTIATELQSLAESVKTTSTKTT